MIEVKNAVVGYNVPLFNVESLQLEKGEVYALIGKNGGGKSTFLNSLLGFNNLLSGTISINSIGIHQMTLKRIAQEIAYVGSKFEGVDYLTVYEYIALGKFPNSNWIGQISKKENVIIDETIEDFKLSHLSSKFTSEISDGERQLCGIARAIVQGTDYIVLDEPSAFLDYINRKKIIDLLLKISKDKNICIVLSTHDLDMAFEAGLNFLAIHSHELKKVSVLKKDELIKFFK